MKTKCGHCFQGEGCCRVFSLEVSGRLSRARQSEVFCGRLSEAAGSWGAVQRHNCSQGKPSKRDGEREEKPKRPLWAKHQPSLSRQNISTRFYFILQLHDFQISCMVWDYHAPPLMWSDCPNKIIQCVYVYHGSFTAYCCYWKT